MNDYKEMKEKIIKWLLKKLVLLWDKDNDKMAFTFGRDEHTGYAVLARRYYFDHVQFGTEIYPTNELPEKESGRVIFWHSVKDELPEFECDVLAFCVNGEETRIAPCTYKPGGNFYDCIFNCHAQGVTHWMGIPAPPKEET